MAEEMRRALASNETIRGEYVYARLGGVSVVVGLAKDIIEGHGEPPEKFVVTPRATQHEKPPTDLDSLPVRKAVGFQYDSVEVARNELAHRLDHPAEGDRYIERLDRITGAIAHTEQLREQRRVREAAQREDGIGL